ncbi:MAG TPA: hypothetical protein DC084_24920, partial [Cupriavidus sp.]|nr:hypothetical protein [Cupriavidus sp.]
RNRPGAGAAGAGCRTGAPYRHESRPAQTQQRYWRAGHHPWPRADGSGRACLSRLQATGDGRCAGKPSAAGAGVRRGAGGGRGQSGGSEPARSRYRQHGVRGARGLPGGDRGRYRPGRRVRAPGRHARLPVRDRACTR